MADIVLHHYDTSPFSELVRLALGMKGLSWKSVIIPSMAPKPDLALLTGGYRKTPVLQIGANIFCDTAIAIDALEALKPNPTLFPAPLGRAGAFLAMWASGPLFMPAVATAMAPAAAMIPQEFWDDRKALFGMDNEKFLPMAPHLKTQFEANLAKLEAILADGRAFIAGNDAGYADLAFHANIWFQSRFDPDPAVLAPFPLVRAWEARINAIGHGDFSEITAADAHAIAKANHPDMIVEVDPASGFAAGQDVTVRTEDPGANPVAGTLARLTHGDIAVLRDVPELGTVAVHFPRHGQIIMPA